MILSVKGCSFLTIKFGASYPHRYNPNKMHTSRIIHTKVENCIQSFQHDKVDKLIR